MSQWKRARVTNPRKNVARRKTTRNKSSSRKKPARRRSNPRTKIAGFDLKKIGMETAMVAAGGMVSEQIVDFVDDNILDPLNVDGPLRGVGAGLATAAMMTAGLYLNKQVKGTDIMPLVYGAMSPLGALAIRSMLGINEDTVVAVDDEIDVQAGYVPRNMNGYVPGLMDGMDDMAGGYFTNSQLGITQPDHAHMQGQYSAMQGYDDMQGIDIDDGSHMQGVNPAA